MKYWTNKFYNLGTDATHADHIETIKERKYVSFENSRFFPAELGLGLVEGYDSMGYAMSKPNLRAALEEDLKAFVKFLQFSKLDKKIFENVFHLLKNLRRS